MTCCIRLYDPCIKYAQCLCADGLIRLTQKECFFCLSFPENYPYNRNLWFLLKMLFSWKTIDFWYIKYWYRIFFTCLRVDDFCYMCTLREEGDIFFRALNTGGRGSNNFRSGGIFLHQGRGWCIVFRQKVWYPLMLLGWTSI